MITAIVIAGIGAAAATYIGHKYGVAAVKAAVEAEFVKVETSATAEVKALIAAVRAKI